MPSDQHISNTNKPRRLSRGLLLVFLSLATLFGNAQEPVFKQGDRVCFIGNSITYAGGFFHQIALYYATRYPDKKLDIINCGVPGNVAAQVIARMDSDILVYKPTIAVVKLGMNDVDKSLYTTEAAKQPDILQKRQKALDIYCRDYETIINILLKYGCKIILQTPTIYDETAALADVRLPGRNAGLKKFAAHVKELGAKYHLQVVDYWTPMDEIGRKYQQNDSTKTIIGPDRVHPGALGHFIMAYEFLHTTQPQAMVSSATVDATKTEKSSGTNGKLSALKSNANGVSFTWDENALPFPVAKDARPVLDLVPFTYDVNRELLTVTNLRAGNYNLLIDGKNAGAYTHAQLASGINLAENTATPQYIQAAKVLELFQQWWQLESKTRFLKALQAGRMHARNYSVAEAEAFFKTQFKANPDTASKGYKYISGFEKDYMPVKRQEPAMLAQMRQIHDQIYTINKPVAHNYQLIRQ